MVWAFFAGLCVGLPAGCYLREQGYTSKFRNAYRALTPNSEGNFLFIFYMRTF